jgi:predicted nucleic acid-binding protein
MAAIRRTPFVVQTTKSLAPRALKLAHETGRSVYDSLYLALAIRRACPLVTADERFFNGLQGGPYAPNVRWFADPALL